MRVSTRAEARGGLCQAAWLGFRGSDTYFNLGQRQHTYRGLPVPTEFPSLVLRSLRVTVPAHAQLQRSRCLFAVATSLIFPSGRSPDANTAAEAAEFLLDPASPAAPCHLMGFSVWRSRPALPSPSPAGMSPAGLVLEPRGERCWCWGVRNSVGSVTRGQTRSCFYLNQFPFVTQHNKIIFLKS